MELVGRAVVRAVSFWRDEFRTVVVGCHWLAQFFSCDLFRAVFGCDLLRAHSAGRVATCWRFCLPLPTCGWLPIRGDKVVQ